MGRHSQSLIAIFSEVVMIDEAVKGALRVVDRDAGFTEQLKVNRQFHSRMERAGVVTKRQGFTIPLMERIAHVSGR